MDESGILGTLRDAVAWLAGALVGLLMWLGRQQMARIDEHEQRIDDLEDAAVTKADITQMETRITAAINAGAAHMAERMGDVRASADKAHERLDDLLRGGRQG